MPGVVWWGTPEDVWRLALWERSSSEGSQEDAESHSPLQDFVRIDISIIFLDLLICFNYRSGGFVLYQSQVPLGWTEVVFAICVIVIYWMHVSQDLNLGSTFESI